MLTQNLLDLTRYELGKLGEKLARFIIYDKTSLESIQSIPHYGDLILSNGAYIEVKTIRRNKDGSFRVTLDKPNSQSLGHSNFVLLQVIHSNDFIDRYIIPSSALATKRLRVTEALIPYHENYDLLLNFISNKPLAA